MKTDIVKLVGERLKETPSGVSCKSQALLVRAGYIKQVSMGIYSLMPLAQRVSLKIQNIMREEMNAIGGEEVLFPVVMPKEMWDDSGRYSSIGSEMVRFNDRNNHPMLLGMTHEEAAVQMCKNTVKSYDELPFMIYQIQTKFRDEARPRAGLIRVREFTMKDAYSFHTSQEDLENYYKKAYDAYNRIYKRVGLKNFIAVGSDSGMMGGKVAHEFMELTPIGEDTLVICDSCDYKANMEVASSVIQKIEDEEEPIEEVFTGKAHTIEEVCKDQNTRPEDSIKSVCYAVIGNSEEMVIVFVRGDREVNEAKVKAIIKKDIAPKDLDGSGLVKGNIGPLGLNVNNATILFDKSLEGRKNLIAGANKADYHIKHISMPRDFKDALYYDISKVKELEKCPICKKGKLQIENGIEIGNIFQLGTKYTASMGMTVHDKYGREINPIMGCYGIGIGRLIASIAEEYADEKGLVWPITVAPYDIVFVAIRPDNNDVSKTFDKYLTDLSDAGFDVLFDKRNISAGIKFNDSELLGIPIRVVISPRSLENGEAEITVRRSGEKFMVGLDNLVEFLKQLKKDICQ